MLGLDGGDPDGEDCGSSRKRYKKISEADRALCESVMEAEFRSIRRNIPFFRGTKNFEAGVVLRPDESINPLDLVQQVREHAPSYTRIILDVQMRKGRPVEDMDPEEVHHSALSFILNLSQLMRWGNRKATQGAKLQFAVDVRNNNASAKARMDLKLRRSMNARYKRRGLLKSDVLKGCEQVDKKTHRFMTVSDHVLPS